MPDSTEPDSIQPGEHPATEPESEEQAARERRMWIALSAAGAVVLVVFFALAWPIMRGRLDAVDQVNQAHTLLLQADNSIGSVDKVVTAQLSPDAAAGVPDVSPQLLVARRELAQANALVAQALPHLTEDEINKANGLRSAIGARQIMVDRAPAILSASVKAVRAKQLADQAAQTQARASRLETAAATAYQMQTASGVESTRIDAATIATELSQAQALYSQAASAFPQAGLEGYVAAVAARQKAVAALATAADEWLGAAKPSAQLAWRSYQALAASAGSVQAQLPVSAGEAIGKGFRRVAGGSADAYQNAKSQAISAEAALRTP